MKIEKRLFRTLRLKPAVVKFDMKEKKPQITTYDLNDLENRPRARNPFIRIK
jgi:hypothetical protein